MTKQLKPLTDEQKAKAILETEGGCVENLICPKCGHYGEFRIEVTVTCLVRVAAEGVLDDTHGDNEWENGSRIDCVRCGHSTTVGDFTIPEAEVERLAGLLDVLEVDLDEGK